MKQKLVLLIAAAVGILAFVMTHLYLKAERQRLFAGAQKVEILVARSDLPAGTVLSSKNIAQVQAFETSVGRDVFRKDRWDKVRGKTLRYPLRKNAPVTWMHLDVNMDELSGLAATVRVGMRAISIPVSTETAVSNLVKPNDHVDILGTFTFNSTTRPGELETQTLTVLQDVTILATGQNLARSEFQVPEMQRRSSYSTVTIEVFPEEAEVLAFAMNVKGTLMLSLRNPRDVEPMADQPPVDFKQLQDTLPRLNQLRRERTSTTRAIERMSN